MSADIKGKSRWWPAVLGVPGIALMLAVYASPWSETLQARLVRPIEFSLRHWLGRDPGLDPRIRIWAFGDSTANELQREDALLDEWADVVANFAPQNPSAVIIDKVFGMPFGIEHAEKFVSKLKEAPFPVIGAAFFTPNELHGRETLSPEPFDLGESLDGVPAIGSSGLASLDWLPITTGYFYGPNPRVAEAFDHVGHSLYESGRTALFVRTARHVAVPHSSLYLTGSFLFRGGNLYVDGERVRTDSRGRVVVNLGHPSTYFDHFKAMRTLIQRARTAEQPEEPLPADAIVILVSRFATGALDVLDSPFGPVPAPFVFASNVHSAITGQWIYEVPNGWIAILVAGMLGVLCGRFLAVGWLLLALGAGAAALGAAGVASFISYGAEVPWLLSVGSLVLAALPISAERYRVAETKLRRLRDALEGALPKPQLDAILARNAPPLLEPTGRVVTIMFIDIVGFSAAAEAQTPKEAFGYLKGLMSELAGMVHRHGGVVDKTMGDGMLCFFGYHYDGQPSRQDHADHALACAIAIQRMNVRRILEAHKKGEPVYPLRIGVNSSAVYIGDIGSERRADLTLIGHGVNYAKRLESACENYCVLIGATTRDMLLGLESMRVTLTKRLVPFKHVGDLIEAYECDPFAAEPELKARVITAHREFTKAQRKEERWEVPGGYRVRVTGQWLAGELSNFSESGVGVIAGRYLGRGVAVHFTIEGDARLTARLDELGLLPLVGEVRWGRPLDDGRFLLGLLIKNLSVGQRRLFLEELRTHFTQGSAVALKRA